MMCCAAMLTAHKKSDAERAMCPGVAWIQRQRLFCNWDDIRDG